MRKKSFVGRVPLAPTGGARGHSTSPDSLAGSRGSVAPGTGEGHKGKRRGEMGSKGRGSMENGKKVRGGKETNFP